MQLGEFTGKRLDFSLCEPMWLIAQSVLSGDNSMSSIYKKTGEDGSVLSLELAYSIQMSSVCV